MRLEGLIEDDAQHLLLQAAEIPMELWVSYGAAALAIVNILGSHPLALIQAGVYIARGHCRLNEYLNVFQRQRRRLLQFHPVQAQSRYGHVYATFEASAYILEESPDEAASDALDLLRILSMLSPSGLPIDFFESAWKGARAVCERHKDEDDTDVRSLTHWHVYQLVPFIQVGLNEWDAFSSPRSQQSAGIAISHNKTHSKGHDRSFHASTDTCLGKRPSKQRPTEPSADFCWIDVSPLVRKPYLASIQERVTTTLAFLPGSGY